MSTTLGERPGAVTPAGSRGTAPLGLANGIREYWVPFPCLIMRRLALPRSAQTGQGVGIKFLYMSYSGARGRSPFANSEGVHGA